MLFNPRQCLCYERNHCWDLFQNSRTPAGQYEFLHDFIAA